ncbi:GNAT family N-acetyltransferase, partial [Candidatus Uhrbacteria bacterium]|nr:GNAT family N-acetyltransferase [Candidatus Uhrbacteria bacterium]
KHVPFEELRGVEMQQRLPKELSDEDQESMMRIAQENWKDVKLKHAALTSLEEKFASEDDQTRFHLLKKDGKILGFVRFDDLENGDLYAGSLNISPTLRGSAIGEALLNEVMVREGEDRPIHAHADPTASVLTAYIERFGFVIEGTEEVEIRPGQIVSGVRIRKDPETWSRPDSMDEALTQKQLLAMHSGHAPTAFTMARYNLNTDAEQMIEDIKRETEGGRCVTRFFENRDEPGSRYAVFDAPPLRDVPIAAE